jgi:hypothetical protein
MKRKNQRNKMLTSETIRKARVFLEFLFEQGGGDL